MTTTATPSIFTASTELAMRVDEVMMQHGNPAYTTAQSAPDTMMVYITKETARNNRLVQQLANTTYGNMKVHVTTDAA